MGKFSQFFTELSACDTIIIGSYCFTIFFFGDSKMTFHVNCLFSKNIQKKKKNKKIKTVICCCCDKHFFFLTFTTFSANLIGNKSIIFFPIGDNLTEMSKPVFWEK